MKLRTLSLLLVLASTMLLGCAHGPVGHPDVPVKLNSKEVSEEVLEFKHSDYYFTSFILRNNNFVEIRVVVPRDGPMPSRRLSGLLECASGHVDPRTRPTLRTDNEFREFVASRPELSLVKRSFSVNDVSVSCVDDGVRIAAPRFEDIFTLLAMPRDPTGFYDQRNLPNTSLRTNAGSNWLYMRIAGFFRYPSIRREFLGVDVILKIYRGRIEVLAAGNISGYDYAAVALTDSGLARLPLSFDPEKPVTVAVLRDSQASFRVWDYVTVDYDAGVLIWRRLRKEPQEVLDR